MTEVRLAVGSAMGCRHCVREVTGWLRDVAGVETITADARTGIVVISGTMDVPAVLAAFAGSVYRPRLLEDPPAATGA